MIDSYIIFCCHFSQNTKKSLIAHMHGAHSCSHAKKSYVTYRPMCWVCCTGYWAFLSYQGEQEQCKAWESCGTELLINTFYSSFCCSFSASLELLLSEYINHNKEAKQNKQNGDCGLWLFGKVFCDSVYVFWIYFNCKRIFAR